ncbi:MAG: hypothetical protein AAGH68_12500 [Pseudomonadota bacterium]
MSWRKISVAGHKFEVARTTLGLGGQGKVYRARRADTKHPAIFKTMPTSAEAEQRLRWLVDQRLGQILPQVAAPLAWKEHQGELAYIAALANGVPLDEDRPRTFPERLELVWILSCLWSRLETAGIAHGDVAPSNIMIMPNGWADLIDLDNYVTQDPLNPAPSMIGQHPMMAPELRMARNAGQPIPPTIESDRFAWAVLFSLLLFYRHPTDGQIDGTPASFDAAMTSGIWPERNRAAQAGETPMAAVGEPLAKLFDGAFSLQQGNRPNAAAWRVVLGQSLKAMVRHRCGQVFVGTSARTCPWCGAAIQMPTVHGDQLTIRVRNIDTGREAAYMLSRGRGLMLGRDTIPDATAYVSGRHLELVIVGQDLRLVSHGRNGTTVTLGQTPRQSLNRLATALPGSKLDGAVLDVANTRIELRIGR